MTTDHLIVCQVQREGYRCGACNAFHRAGHVAFMDHLPHAIGGMCVWTELACWALDDVTGLAVRVPSAIGKRALATAE